LQKRNRLYNLCCCRTELGQQQQQQQHLKRQQQQQQQQQQQPLVIKTGWQQCSGHLQQHNFKVGAWESQITAVAATTATAATLEHSWLSESLISLAVLALAFLRFARTRLWSSRVYLEALGRTLTTVVLGTLRSEDRARPIGARDKYTANKIESRVRRSQDN